MEEQVMNTTFFSMRGNGARWLIAPALAALAALALAGCGNNGNNGNNKQANQSMNQAPAAQTMNRTAGTGAMNQNMANQNAGNQNMGNQNAGNRNMGGQMNRYGGPSYTGKPALGVTVALVKAGGGPSNFSLVTALKSMLGADTVNSEVSKLKNQYSDKKVKMWVKVMNFYVDDALKIIKNKGINLPPAANMSGKQLAKALVKAGTAQDGTFWAGNLFDHALSHNIHVQLMNDADKKFGEKWDANAHAVTNQAFYDVAQALGMNNVKLAPFHS
jgi:hypothetical protein